MRAKSVAVLGGVFALISFFHCFIPLMACAWDAEETAVLVSLVAVDHAIAKARDRQQEGAGDPRQLPELIKKQQFLEKSLGLTGERDGRRKTPKNFRNKELDQLFVQVGTEEGISPTLLKAVGVVESGLDPRAKSPKGAVGIMQLMPSTAVALNVEDIWDPYQNIKGGARYLKQLIAKYRDLRKALIAYVGGPGLVGKPLLDTHEANVYVERVLRVYSRLNHG